MGLGKTLSMLALIAGLLNESQNAQEQAQQSTLIVSPLSSMFWFHFFFFLDTYQLTYDSSLWLGEPNTRVLSHDRTVIVR